MKFLTKLLLVLALITANICSGQIEKDTLVAFQYYQKADSLFTAEKFHESVALFEKALSIYKKAKGLQQAKLQYLEQADTYKAAPFYWGGFYLVGDKTPIDFGMDPIGYWIIGLVLLAVLTGVIFLGRKNRRITPGTK